MNGDGWKDGQMDERTNGQTDERTNGRMDKRTNGQTDKRTNGQTNGLTVRVKNIFPDSFQDVKTTTKPAIEMFSIS